MTLADSIAAAKRKWVLLAVVQGRVERLYLLNSRLLIGEAVTWVCNQLEFFVVIFASIIQEPRKIIFFITVKRFTEVTQSERRAWRTCKLFTGRFVAVGKGQCV